MVLFGVETMMRPKAVLDNRGFPLPGNVLRCAGPQWMGGGTLGTGLAIWTEYRLAGAGAKSMHPMVVQSVPPMSPVV